ncbi:unnamed protein product [Musa hybrid cultivar]
MGVARFLCVAFASLRSIISFTAPSRPTKSSRIPEDGQEKVVLQQFVFVHA